MLESPLVAAAFVLALLAMFVWPFFFVKVAAKAKNRSVGTSLRVQAYLALVLWFCWGLEWPAIVASYIPTILLYFLPRKPLKEVSRSPYASYPPLQEPTAKIGNPLFDLFSQYRELLFDSRFHSQEELSRLADSIEVGIGDLLEKGTEVECRDEEGRSPLMLAAECHSLALVEKLVRAGASVDSKDMRGWTALSYSLHNHLTTETLNDHEQVLIEPLWSRNSSTVQMLLDAGANANFRDNEGRTPLLHAVVPVITSRSETNSKPQRLVFHSDSGLVKDLLTAGAEVNASDPQGRTALRFLVFSMLAAAWPSEEMAAEVFSTLVQFGADPDYRDVQGRTILMEVLEPYSPLRWPHPFFLNIVLRLLLQSRADVNAQYPQGGTAWTRVLQTMRNMRGTFGDQHYRTKLHESFMVVVRLLLWGGADKDAKCVGGKKPAEIAQELGLHDLLGLLRGSDDYSEGTSGHEFRSSSFTALEKCYLVLGCSERDSDDTVKSRYRKLVKDFHPDTIVGKQLPEEFVKFAHEKFREVQEAFDHIRKARGMA